MDDSRITTKNFELGKTYLIITGKSTHAWTVGMVIGKHSAGGWRVKSGLTGRHCRIDSIRQLRCWN